MDSRQSRGTTTDWIVGQMAEYPIFAGVETHYLERLARGSRVENFRAGDVVIEEGAWDEDLFFLLSGRVKVVKAGEEVCTLEGKGDLFGEMRVIDGQARSATVIAVDDVACQVLDVACMDRLSLDERTLLGSILYRRFAELLASRLRQADEELARLRAKNLYMKQRLKNLVGTGIGNKRK
ncbi:MAG: cyclic nucleotide-binding domain-containing protein [Desulfatibacillaceae bacterium]